ncbi:hypothetical protein ACP179_06300 [Xenorhabdus stockiae]|uniref:hypothetical protein n=1 Tax=Xenorhabdus stockiae TaxID=351614 RepID=UPI003CF67FA8
MKNPNLIPKPFAQNGQKDAIPTNHKSDLPSQKATWDTGFPQITMMPVTAGGLPPSGRDFNGILNQISENVVYLSQGGKFKYSQEYADSTGGYPKGAILQSDDETREFQSLTDNNKINFNKESPEKVSAAWKQVSTTQLLDELNKKFNRSDVVQSVGGSKMQVMSQNAVTDALNTKQDKGDYATNSALNQVNDNANSRLEKAKNGADIQDKTAFINNLGFIEQRTGSSTTTVMSQNAVTDAVSQLQPKGRYADGNRFQVTTHNVSMTPSQGTYALALQNGGALLLWDGRNSVFRVSPEGEITDGAMAFSRLTDVPLVQTTGNSATSFMSQKAVTEASLANGVVKNMINERVANIRYVNHSSRARHCIITGDFTKEGSASVEVDDLTVQYLDVTASNVKTGAMHFYASFIVPAGKSYTLKATGSFILGRWTEIQ